MTGAGVVAFTGQVLVSVYESWDDFLSIDL